MTVSCLHVKILEKFSQNENEIGRRKQWKEEENLIRP